MSSSSSYSSYSASYSSDSGVDAVQCIVVSREHPGEVLLRRGSSLLPQLSADALERPGPRRGNSPTMRRRRSSTQGSRTSMDEVRNETHMKECASVACGLGQLLGVSATTPLADSAGKRQSLFVVHVGEEGIVEDQRIALAVVDATGVYVDGPHSPCVWAPVSRLPKRLPDWVRDAADTATAAGEGIPNANQGFGEIWERAGWCQKACERLTADLGPGTVTQFDVSALGVLLLVRTTAGNEWLFKQPSCAFPSEANTTKLLSDTFPNECPRVHAVVDVCDDGELEPVAGSQHAASGFIMAFYRETTRAKSTEEWKALIRTFARMQISGCHSLSTRSGWLFDMNLDRTAELAMRDAPRWALSLPFSPEVEAEMSPRRRDALFNAATEASTFMGLLTNGSLPSTITHGDLHPGNVLFVPDETGESGTTRPIIIDWSDASIGHPFLSVVPLLLSSRLRPLAADPDAMPGSELTVDSADASDLSVDEALLESIRTEIVEAYLAEWLVAMPTLGEEHVREQFQAAWNLGALVQAYQLQLLCTRCPVLHKEFNEDILDWVEDFVDIAEDRNGLA